MNSTIDYKSSGVDTGAGDRLVDWIQAQPPLGKSQNIIGGVGGFAALFRLDIAQYKKPVLVSCTDGVGTKVKWAAEMGRVFLTGIDLVAMCVNDLITCGAEPLFFLDYFATSKLDLSQAQELLKGIHEGLKQSDCALIGGETAEMPGVYQKGEYDCAGFCVGLVEENQIISGKNVKPGDVAVGVSSSGFHSNGYSLLRKLFEKDAHQYIDQLMAPTRIYVPLVKRLIGKIEVKAMAHVTGGGILGNVPRVMPQGTALKIEKWPWPDSFAEAQRRGGLDVRQMLETFNCGVGYVFFTNTSDVKSVVDESRELGWAAMPIGHVVKHTGEAQVLL